MPTVRVKPGHVQPVWAGHPWVYAQAIERIEGEPVRGDEVGVVDPRGNLLSLLGELTVAAGRRTQAWQSKR